MKQHKSRLLSAALLTITTLFCVSTAAHAANNIALNSLKSLSSQQSENSITLGWTNWSDAEFMIQLAKQQIESHTDLHVNAQQLRIDVQYRAVAQGDIDGMVMAWLPDTHKKYWKKYHDQVVDLGPMYTGADVGLAVPAYVSKAKIDSIADLKNSKIAKQLGGVIHGIDPASGEMQATHKVMKEYGLSDNYKLMDGSDASMTQALSQAINNLNPIVVTLWTPHWAFAKWDLRFLKDPKHVYGNAQHVDVIVRKGFRKDHPEVAKFLSNFQVPLAKLQHAMRIAHQSTEKTAVKRFVKKYPGLVASWWAGTGASVSGMAADASMK